MTLQFGLKITFNNIIIEPREHVDDLVPKIYAEEGELDDLIETFEQLQVDEKISRELLKVSVEQARNQLERNSGVMGLTKKLKKKKKK